MRTFLAVLLAAALVQLAVAARLRLLHSVEHDRATSRVELHDFEAVGPVGATMQHYLHNSTTRHLQAVRGDSDRDFVLLMADVAAASYDSRHSNLPPNTKDAGRESDPTTKYYSYVFEDTHNADVLYIGFPGTESLAMWWYDIKTWIGDHIGNSKEVCPKVHEYSDDVWQIVQEEEKKDEYDYFDAADAMTQKVLKLYPGKKVTFAGHSLGGAMAAMMSRKYNMDAVTMSSPGTVRLQAKHNLPTDFNTKLRNFADSRDLVGMVGYHAGLWCGYDIDRQCPWYDVGCLLNTPVLRHSIEELIKQMELLPQLTDCQCAPALSDTVKQYVSTLRIE
jgi:hypothetical protein